MKKRKTKISNKRRKLSTLPLLILAVAAAFGFFLFKNTVRTTPELTCANSISCTKDLSGKIESEISGVFDNKSIAVPPILLSERDVLGQTTPGSNTGEKRIDVDLSTQKLYAYEGDKLVYTFRVSTGKWYPTPTGEFKIWIKLRATRMTGGNPARGTYYDLPNVPFVMFYHNNEVAASRGFSLHGTYWHNNFGYPMSHGCINLRTVDAEKLYYWTTPEPTSNSTYASADNPGTVIRVYGSPPEESL